MRRISLDTDDLTGFILPVKFVNITENFAFDVTTNHIYWTDGTKIYSSRSNGSNTMTVITATMSSIKSLSVDWISGNLFWTDFLNGKIKISNLDGSLGANLMSHGLETPRDIVVDPMKGLLFFTDTGRKVIERSYTNGQSRIVIASRDIYYPVGLAADFDTEFLYWTDSMYHTIERCTYDGRRRFTVVNRDVHAFGLAVLGSYVYWTDNRQHALLRADKETGGQRSVLEEHLEIPLAVAALSIRKNPETSSCFKNGNCKNLCLPTPNGRSCANVCDGKLYLKDSCDIQKITPKRTKIKPSISCTLGHDRKNCSDGTVKNVTKGKETMKIAYIVGGIVFVAFILTMSVLLFLCHRRLKAVVGKNKQKQTMPWRVTFENRRTASRGDSVNDPLVTISSKYQDQISTRSSPSSVEKFPDRSQLKNKNETEEANPCLTISNV